MDFASFCVGKLSSSLTHFIETQIIKLMIPDNRIKMLIYYHTKTVHGKVLVDSRYWQKISSNAAFCLIQKNFWNLIPKMLLGLLVICKEYHAVKYLCLY